MMNNQNYHNVKQYSQGNFYNTYSALIVFLLYLLSYMLIVILAFKIYPVFGLYSLLFGIACIPFFMLASYDIDCVFSGGCNIWGYIRTIFTSISIIITIISTIILLFINKNLYEEIIKF